MKYKKCCMVPAIVLLWFTFAAAAVGIQFEQQRLEGFHPLDEEPEAATPLNAVKPAVLELKSKLFFDQEDIDFEKRQITFRRVDSLGFTMWEYHFPELSDYLSSRKNFVLTKSWYNDVANAKRTADPKKQQKNLKMQWELPVQYPSWAQRILGNEPPRLVIDGNLTITMGFDRSTIKEGNESRDNQSSTNDFGFDMQYQFGIQGTVGKLINVGIRVADAEFVSENNFKNFKIEYKESTPGEMEDEIIQEVIAGWTNFDMPGTELSGYSGGKDGLFGIKIKSKLGPLTLTTIASQEKGEAQKLNVSLKNGSNQSDMLSSAYRRDVFYFLDTLYRNLYNKNYRKKKTDPSYEAAPYVDTLEIYIKKEVYQTNQLQDSLQYAKASDGQMYYFYKLIPDKHYELFEDQGYVRFDTTINTYDLVGIYLRAGDGKIKKGERGDTLKVWTLKPRTSINAATDDPERFFLMWRNVYDLDTNMLATFELSTWRVLEGQDSSLYTANGSEKRLISAVLGLTGEDGKPLTDYDQIYDKKHEYIIVPPYDTCPTCNEPFNNPTLGAEYRDSLIYRISQEHADWREYKPLYKFKTSGSKKVTSINLGWQVMHNTELVKTSGGEVLERDRDYIIDYESGTVELVSPRALAADNVDVTFQQEAMFVPESKVFLGVRGEMALPFLSEKSFIGVSLLFQNAGTNDIPRLEQEPYSKLLIDLNLKADFEPEWMTYLINKLPLVKTEQPSSVVLEFEAANSITNPNTNDEAYIDDFEDSRKTYPLGSHHETWSKASPPQYLVMKGKDSLPRDTIQIADSLHKYPPAWDWYWFQPRSTEEKPISQKVWIPSSSRPQSGDLDYDPILRLHCTPFPEVPGLKHRFKNAWAGIMTPISQSSIDRSRDKYFEFCMNKKDSKGKKLIVQMGVMNEDISLNGGPPNRQGDREDTTLAGTGGLELDRGLDRLWDDKEYYLIPNSTMDGWDTLKPGNEILGVFKNDPAKDNARNSENGAEYENDLNMRWRACRNQWDHRYSTEDLGYDGTVQTSIKESYYEFVLNLDSIAQYADTTARVYKENGWMKYRIPIHDASSIRNEINKPSWSNISMVRLIWTEFDTSANYTETQLMLSDLQFTGNYWLAQSDTNSTTRAEATSLNNQEDEYYKLQSSTPLIHHEKIPGTQDNELESALKIIFSDVKTNDTALVRKLIPFQAMDVSQYERMTLVYYGDNEYGNLPNADNLMYNGEVEFIFRFGNNDSTYYEYHDVIRSGWNFANINLLELTKVKSNHQIRNPGGTIDASSGHYRVYSNRAGIEPSLTKITWMALGIRNNSNKKVTGSIWVNEMKVDGIHKLKGWAARASLKTKWADFMNIDARVSYTGGDFRMMNESGYSARDSKFDGSISGSMNLDRFLPRDLGISVPVGGSISSSVDRPELKKNSDIRLENDGVYEMVVDAARLISDEMSKDDEAAEAVDDVSESEWYGRKTFRGTVYTNYGKSAQSENPLVNLTADRITTNFTYSKSVSTTNMGPSPNKDQIYNIRDEANDYTAKLQYDLTPRENHSWRPFEKNDKKWAEKLKRYELNLLPSTLKFNLADLNYGKSMYNETEKNVRRTTYRYDLNHGVNLNYSPISPLLSFDYSLSISRDLDSRVDSTKDSWDKVMMAFKRDEEWKEQTVLNGEKNRNQQVSIDLKPELISWLTTDASYSSSFASTMVTRLNDTNLYTNASVSPKFTFNSSLQIESILDKISDTTKLKTIGRFFGKVKKGYDKIGLRNISFTYSSDMNLRNDYFSEDFFQSRGVNFWDYFKYQTGFSGRSFTDVIAGTMDDESNFGGMRNRYGIDDEDLYRNDARSADRRYSISTGLNFRAPIELSISPISFEWSDHKSLQAKDPSYFDKSRTLPKIQIGANTPALMKIKLIKQYFSSMRCNTSYNFEKTKSWTSVPKFSDAERHILRPLISITGEIAKAPITVNYSCDKSNERQRLGSTDASINSETTQEKLDHTFSINYEIQKNSRLSELKLFSWTIPVSGKTTVGMKGNVSRNLGYKTESGKEKEKTEHQNSFSLSPKVTYVFTDNINGEMYYEFGKQKMMADTETKTTNKFAIILNVRL